MSYPFVLPTTGSVALADFFENLGPYSKQISEATAQRGRLRAALKTIKRQEQLNKDYQEVINTIEDYLPYLFGIIACIEGEELKPRGDIVTSWRSTLSGHTKGLGGQKPRVNCKGIKAELCFVLMTYAYAFCLRGSEIVSSIPPESDHSEVQYNKAADMLNKAAGIFSYIADSIEHPPPDSSSPRAIELHQDAAMALSKLAAADAQSAAISKALVHSKVSSSLIAKLYMGVANQYDTANGLLSSLPNSEIASDLKRYLSDGTAFYKAMAKKHLSLDANDNQNAGIAVGFMREAKAELHALKKVSKSTLSITHSTVASRATKEEEAVTDLLGTLTRLNDTVSYQTVPSRQELQKIVPNGRGILQLKQYHPPDQCFGPSSVGRQDQQYARAGTYW
ncbi:BRO1-like domain-containing protein [Umbelopsis sp. AD052]|nr:BRO1-like domain-containing protein [Umbelopsis sp. AD052]